MSQGASFCKPWFALRETAMRAGNYGIANDAVHRWSCVRRNQRTGLIQNRVVKSVSHCGEAFTSAQPVPAPHTAIDD